mgnify:CR=1 FL=1
MLPNLLLTHSDEISGVIHVGAHLGQELKYYMKYNFEKILLFEPQFDIYEKLIKNKDLSKNVECYNFALGSKNETKKLNKSDENEGLSSSLLSPKLHLKVQPDISFLESEIIEVKRFDSLEIETLNFLTLDVQGFELEVLKGFGNKLNEVEFIFTEINTKQLYKDNALVTDLDHYLEKFNFVRVFTNVDSFNFFGDAFYVKKTNPKYSNNFLRVMTNKINISNLFISLKKFKEPKKMIKQIL